MSSYPVVFWFSSADRVLAFARARHFGAATYVQRSGDAGDSA